jgi:hypothetical protein
MYLFSKRLVCNLVFPAEDVVLNRTIRTPTVKTTVAALVKNKGVVMNKMI